MYTGGAWGEFVAPVGVLLLYWAGLRAVLRYPHGWTFMLAVTGEAWLSAGHGITLVWGNAIVALSLIVFVAGGVLFPSLRRRFVSWAVFRGLATCVVGMTLGLMINAWWVVPAVLLRTSLRVSDYFMNVQTISTSVMYSDLGNVLSLVPRDPVTTDLPNLYVQLPTAAICFSIGVLGVSLVRPKLRVAGLLVSVACLVVMLGIYVLNTGRGWEYMPSILRIIQFPHRAWTYAGIAAAILVIGACTTANRPDITGRIRGIAAVGALSLCIISLSIAIQVAWSSGSHDSLARYTATRGEALNWYDPGLFRNRFEPGDEIAVNTLTFEPSGEDRAEWSGSVAGQESHLTNIALPRALFRAENATLEGYDTDGFAVLRPIDGNKPIRVWLERGEWVAASVWVSRAAGGLSLLILAVLLVRAIGGKVKAPGLWRRARLTRVG